MQLRWDAFRSLQCGRKECWTPCTLRCRACRRWIVGKARIPSKRNPDLRIAVTQYHARDGLSKMLPLHRTHSVQRFPGGTAYVGKSQLRPENLSRPQRCRPVPQSNAAMDSQTLSLPGENHHARGCPRFLGSTFRECAHVRHFDNPFRFLLAITGVDSSESRRESISVTIRMGRHPDERTTKRHSRQTQRNQSSAQFRRDDTVLTSSEKLSGDTT